MEIQNATSSGVSQGLDKLSVNAPRRSLNHTGVKMLIHAFSEVRIGRSSSSDVLYGPPLSHPGTHHSSSIATLPALGRTQSPCRASPLRLRPAEAVGLLTDCVHPVCEEQSPRATTSSGGGRLGPRVPSSDNYHVEVRAAGCRAVAAEATQRQPSAEGR